MASRAGHNKNGEAAPQSGEFMFVNKARRPLPLTVRGDQGLREGEVWMVEGRRLDFWSGERLGVGGVYELRVDLQAQGSNVDLRVKVLRVQVGRSAGVEHGYLHHAVFRAKSAEDGRRFERVFWRLNPEHAPEPGAGIRPHPSRREAPANPGSSQPGRSRRSSGRPSVSSMASDGFQTHRIRKHSGGGSSSKPSRHWSTRNHDAREPRPAILPPVERSERVSPQIAPGDPPGVMVRYQAVEALRADLLLEGADLYLFLAPTREIEPMWRVMLHLQLPQGHYVMLEARVWESTHRGCVLVARGVSPSLLANLRAAVGARRS